MQNRTLEKLTPLTQHYNQRGRWRFKDWLIFCKICATSTLNDPQKFKFMTQTRKALQRDLTHLAEKYARDPNTVKLLAVSKTRSIDEIIALADQGQTCFGENYLQEALDKITALRDRQLEWHYIGGIQSNKTKPIAENFDWVHTVDRLKIAQRLNDQRPTDKAPLNICIQINSSGENSKGGVTFDELSELARQILSLPRLRLRGLMTLPAPEADLNRQRQPFLALRQARDVLRDQLRATQPDLDTLCLDSLSMGTSNDYEAAIAEGGTLIRIGTALFGPRSYPADNA